MHAQRIVPNRISAALTLLACLFASTTSIATTFNWNKPNGCGIFSCDFFDASHWSPGGGPPSDGDVVFIDMDGGTHLTQDTGQLASLTLQSNASLTTSGNILSVTESQGNLFLFGTGFNGSTVLRVDQGPALFEVVARTVSLHQGAEILLQGGTVASTFRVLVSQSSLISGHGTIGLVGNGIDSSIQVAGTIRPHGGDITIIAPNSSHDLDCSISGVEPGFLDITSTGNLVVNGEQADPFSGQIALGNNRSLTLDSHWDIDGTLNFETFGANEIIGPGFTFLSGSKIRTRQSTGQIDGESVWSNGSSLAIRHSADVVTLFDDSEIESGASITGMGRLVNGSGAMMSLHNGTNIEVELNNQGRLEIGDSPGIATLAEYSQGATGILKVSLGGTEDGEFDTFQVNGDLQLGGNLDVSVLLGFSLVENQQFKVVDVQGAASGQFNFLGEGDLVGNYGENLYISYQGGDGNDIILYTTRLPGDFDLDGDVDGADFLTWQRNPAVGLLSDWQTNYGAPSPLTNTTSVPEPATLFTTLIAACISLCLKLH